MISAFPKDSAPPPPITQERHSSVSSAPNKGVLAERAHAEFKFVTKLVGPGAIKNRGQRPRLEYLDDPN